MESPADVDSLAERVLRGGEVYRLGVLDSAHEQVVGGHEVVLVELDERQSVRALQLPLPVGARAQEVALLVDRAATLQ